MLSIARPPPEGRISESRRRPPPPSGEARRPVAAAAAVTRALRSPAHPPRLSRARERRPCLTRTSPRHASSRPVDRSQAGKEGTRRVTFVFLLLPRERDRGERPKLEARKAPPRNAAAGPGPPLARAGERPSGWTRLRAHRLSRHAAHPLLVPQPRDVLRFGLLRMCCCCLCASARSRVCSCGRGRSNSISKNWSLECEKRNGGEIFDIVGVGVAENKINGGRHLASRSDCPPLSFSSLLPCGCCRPRCSSILFMIPLFLGVPCRSGCYRPAPAAAAAKSPSPPPPLPPPPSPPPPTLAAAGPAAAAARPSTSHARPVPRSTT